MQIALDGLCFLNYDAKGGKLSLFFFRLIKTIGVVYGLGFDGRVWSKQKLSRAWFFSQFEIVNCRYDCAIYWTNRLFEVSRYERSSDQTSVFLLKLLSERLTDRFKYI